MFDKINKITKKNECRASRGCFVGNLKGDEMARAFQMQGAHCQPMLLVFDIKNVCVEWPVVLFATRYSSAL
jgi:hypothetical protein